MKNFNKYYWEDKQNKLNIKRGQKSLVSNIKRTNFQIVKQTYLKFRDQVFISVAFTLAAMCSLKR